MNIFRRITGKAVSVTSAICNRAFERRCKRRLKNDNFSIICSNCIGGTIYHRLGKEFLSPTINMWMHQRDFLVFAENLHEYTTIQPKFIASDYNYPVAALNGSAGRALLFFNHSKTTEDALEGWMRRRTRINYDNLYLIMYDIEDLTEDELRRLEGIKCKNKVVLSARVHEGIPWVKTIKPNLSRPNGAQFLDKDCLGIRTYEKQFDFVDFFE